MFLPRETPLELRPEQLLGLRLSLNTPVVSTEEIPTGPARAALAVHRDAEGAPTITLAVRPVQATHAVFYGLEEDLRGDAGLAMGVDAALSFGESLGFLFDDDPVASGQVEAGGLFALWSSIVGDDELSKVMQVTEERRRAPPPILETDLGEELLLEELALDDAGEPLLEDDSGGDLLADDVGEELLDEARDVEPPPPAPAEAGAPTPSLTKFRALAASPESGGGPGRALLARVRLVKRAARAEKPFREPEPGVDLRRRLLTSF